MADHSLDVCDCGDYRQQHRDGIGACVFNRARGGLGHAGCPDCDAFRLFRAVEASTHTGRLGQPVGAS